jgi:hypothetical protein
VHAKLAASGNSRARGGALGKAGTGDLRDDACQNVESLGARFGIELLVRRLVRVWGGGSRKARVSCMATLLIGRWLSVRNQAAAKESVDDHPGMEQIGKWGETGLTVFIAGCRQFIGDSRRFPIGLRRLREIMGKLKLTVTKRRHESARYRKGSSVWRRHRGAEALRQALGQGGRHSQRPHPESAGSQSASRS